jgi:hypothetical protein
MRVWWVAILALVVACGAKPASAPARSTTVAGGLPADTDRFPHGVHTGDRPEIRKWQGRGLSCGDCHDPAAVIAGKVARPGTSQHAPCDDCHKAEFEKPPGAMCRICHVTVDPTKADASASPLQAYPERGSTQTLASSFSHRLHLDAPRMEAATGAHVACKDCHVRDQSRDPLPSGHAACARCHEQNAKVKASLPMARCEGCHVQRGVELHRGRKFITGDLKFAHATHETDREGAPVACTTCHVNVADASSRDDMAVPAMERCAQCHEDARRSPDRVRMSQCAVCHSQIDIGSPPTSHMVSGARPADHTLEFRRHHGDAAAGRDANCRFCHTEVAGVAGDTCFQCHQVMRPQDHNVMFREDHGRDAEADGSRCATCHQPETCTACHSVPPRSHTPIAEFRLGGHAQQARFGLTACLACHTFEDTCSKCHRGAR